MTPSLNLGYIFIQVFGIFSSLQGNTGVAYDQVVFYVESAAVFSMTLSIVLLVLIVYVRIRTVQVEHYGYLMQAERERAHHAEVTAESVNPQWEAVTSLITSPNESDWRRAILEADIMLAVLLTERGYLGDTIGEQLKNANQLQFTTLDLAWEAHRTRNAIAHLGEGFPLSERDARATIDRYRRVFEEFGII